MSPNLSKELQFTLELCDEIDKFTLSSFEKREFSVTTKADLTPVTEIDQETEKRIREAIEINFPMDGIEGEEFGHEIKEGNRSWIIDPIDGTKNYMRGIPIWGTLIALCIDDNPVLGVVSAPSISRRWWGSVGEGAFLNDKRIFVSKVDNLKMSEASYGNITQFKAGGYPDALDRLVDSLARTRAIGDFWSHTLVAEGALECGIDPVCAPWDIAPIKIIVEEAGGKYTSLEGEETIRSNNGISTNGVLHQELCDLLKETSAL